MLSTHILSEIEAVCDRVLILIDGVLAANSTLGDLLSSDRVRLSIADGSGDVRSMLASVEGVLDVTAAGGDPKRAGYQHWSLACSSTEPPTPEIVRAVVGAGWDLASVALESQSLEEVFRDLIDRHAAGAKSEVTA